MGPSGYQDKSRTNHEFDTLTVGTEKENPAASGEANGAGQLWEDFETEECRNRAKAATALCQAIAECHPDDASLMMEAALFSMRAGVPGPTFASVMQEADEWAYFASSAERKAYALASFNRLGAPDRAAFLAYVTEAGHG